MTRRLQKRLVKVGHAWRKHDSLIFQVIEEDPVGSKSLEWLWLRWGKRVVKIVEPNRRK